MAYNRHAIYGLVGMRLRFCIISYSPPHIVLGFVFPPVLVVPELAPSHLFGETTFFCGRTFPDGMGKMHLREPGVCPGGGGEMGRRKGEFWVFLGEGRGTAIGCNF